MDLSQILNIINRPLFPLGDKSVSLATVLLFLLMLLAVHWAARLVRSGLQSRVLTRTALDPGQQYAMARIAGYLVTAIGILVAIATLGIDLTSLTVLLGALGVGIGFGLQSIVNNFVSGLILLLERPVQIGNRVEVEGTAGQVVQIGARSTTVLTNDNIAMVIPNSKFIQETVINWNYGNDRRVRFLVHVGVSYGCDPHEVKRLLLEVASTSPDVLENPSPNVVFKGFGDSSLDFELRVWTDTVYERPSVFRSPIYFAIWDTFKEHDIEIPFPQRDLHVKGPISIRSEES